MTLYRNLGPITFQCQSDSCQVFSTAYSTLILQFKNYQDVNLDEINSLLAVYQLILKQDQLLEIYSEKNKPSSILIHKGVRVAFEKINIHLLCRIIKEMVTSIFHSRKVIPQKIGEVSRQMFFQIDGELRYLYFPTQKLIGKPQNLTSEVLQFFQELKDDKEVSHRLLLKKISKCTSLQQILDETEYFLNIYHAKQIYPSMSSMNTSIQQSFFTKTLNKNTKGFAKNINEHTFNQFRHSSPLAFKNAQSINDTSSHRRKYNLFKTTQFNIPKNSLLQNNNTFYSNTWRKPQKQQSLQNATFRVNSRAVHVDAGQQKGLKATSTSLFNRASSTTQSPKKLTGTKKKSLVISLHLNQRSLHQANQSLLRTQFNQDFSRKKNNLKTYQGQQCNILNHSAISKHIQESECQQKNFGNQSQFRNNQSSQWMKSMVNKSLEKWKNKSNQKISIFKKINEKDREGSTQVDSRSKFLQKNDRISYDMLRQSNISVISQGKNQSKNIQTNKIQNSQVQSHHPMGSQRKLKRTMPGNRSVVVQQQRREYRENQMIGNFEDIQIKQINNFVQKQNLPPIQSIQESLEKIDLGKSSIQNLALKNKEQEIKKLKKMQRKKTSIKEIVFQNTNQERIISDESQTQRIQYSRCSRKNQKSSKAEDSSKDSIKEAIMQQFISSLTAICHQKQQIGYIGVAVVKTNEHLKNFQSIFWQLPMFFLYKKFYEKRLSLYQRISELYYRIVPQEQKSSFFQQILVQTAQYLQQIQTQNISIEQCLKKLLKTVKRKAKKQYKTKNELDNIERYLHLDYTINYDKNIDDMVSIYLGSLLQAKPQFPQLIYHIVDIFQALIVLKGKSVDARQRENIDSGSSKAKLKKIQTYYNSLIERKQIKAIIWPEEVKNKQKK